MGDDSVTASRSYFGVTVIDLLETACRKSQHIVEMSQRRTQKSQRRGGALLPKSVRRYTRKFSRPIGATLDRVHLLKPLTSLYASSRHMEKKAEHGASFAAHKAVNAAKRAKKEVKRMSNGSRSLNSLVQSFKSITISGVQSAKKVASSTRRKLHF